MGCKKGEKSKVQVMRYKEGHKDISWGELREFKTVWDHLVRVFDTTQEISSYWNSLSHLVKLGETCVRWSSDKDCASAPQLGKCSKSFPSRVKQALDLWTKEQGFIFPELDCFAQQGLSQAVKPGENDFWGELGKFFQYYEDFFSPFKNLSNLIYL